MFKPAYIYVKLFNVFPSRSKPVRCPAVKASPTPTAKSGSSRMGQRWGDIADRSDSNSTPLRYLEAIEDQVRMLNVGVAQQRHSVCKEASKQIINPHISRLSTVCNFVTRSSVLRCFRHG